MSTTFEYETHEECVKKWDELVKRGTAKEQMTLYAPHPVHGLDEHLEPKPSKVSFFTLMGGLLGCLTGYGLCLYTSAMSWPIITGGKPQVLSIPAYTVIAFELTILLGGLIGFKGFLLLSRLPSLKNILDPPEFGNKYAIVVEEKE